MHLNALIHKALFFMKKIVLLGYMGSGKSTIGKLLATTINSPYKDLDEIIEKETDLSIKNIFEQKGEVFFRKLETRILTELLRSEERFVLSLGGGTPCYGNNMQLIKNQNTISFHLKASNETLSNRLLNQTHERPLIKDLNKNTIGEFIAKHLFERNYFYNQATASIVTEDKTPAEIVGEILNYSK